MTKLIQALIARILTAQTETAWNMICRDVDMAFQQERIKFSDHEMLYRLIDRLHQA